MTATNGVVGLNELAWRACIRSLLAQGAPSDGPSREAVVDVALELAHDLGVLAHQPRLLPVPRGSAMTEGGDYGVGERHTRGGGCGARVRHSAWAW